MQYGDKPSITIIRFNPNDKYAVKPKGLKLVFRKLPHGVLDGSRIINLDNLATYVGDISKHVLLCPQSAHFKSNVNPIKLLGEVKRQGLHSIIYAECQGCFKIFNLGGSVKLPVKNIFRYDINVPSCMGRNEYWWWCCTFK